MPTGVIVKDKPIQGSAGSAKGAPDQGSITLFVEDSTSKYLIPVFGSVAEDAKSIDYTLATANVSLDIDGVQLSKQMRVAVPNGELAKELESSLAAIEASEGEPTNKKGHVAQPRK